MRRSDVRSHLQRHRPFPDLKGQAPLRRLRHGHGVVERPPLFLTSKVRLHCGVSLHWLGSGQGWAFPDLKGQAPLRHVKIHGCYQSNKNLFLTSKVRLHCGRVTDPVQRRPTRLFLTSKIRFYIFLRIICTPLLEGFTVNPSRQSGSFFIAAMSTRWTI